MATIGISARPVGSSPSMLHETDAERRPFHGPSATFGEAIGESAHGRTAGMRPVGVEMHRVPARPVAVRARQAAGCAHWCGSAYFGDATARMRLARAIEKAAAAQTAATPAMTKRLD
jgi:hypothetical protein